jgi:mannose-1-phosphate guanylyltransferase/mannose-1-phosphate guanylyltransferase/mannose-6-phosphate isomerase
MAAAVVQDLHGPDALLLVMPSDHVIEEVAAFHAAVSAGQRAAGAGRLVTFGIIPTGPETGYGYVQMGEDVAKAPGVREVLRFVEKPEFEAAKRFVAEGDYLWNAGIFLFKASALLREAMALAPPIHNAAVSAVRGGARNGIRITADLASLATCPSDSIDYAVMEKSSNVAVVPTSPGWSDLGSWDAMAELVGTAAPSGPVTTLDCEDCFILSDGMEVAALGLRDLIVVGSGKRLLILPRGRSQEVKSLLSRMPAAARE